MRSPNVQVTVNLDAVRAAAESIRRKTGVRLIPVVKADAYGLGAERVADALAAVADEFAYFAVHEAREIRRPGLVLGPPDGDPAEYRELSLRPGVGNADDAAKFKGLQVAIKMDTGMQRFGCSPDNVGDLVPLCDVQDFFTHAVTVEAAMQLKAACGGFGKPIHAAATDLLDHPETWFDAVRPGLALFRGAVRVTTRLRAVHSASGPIGYTGFTAPRVGVIIAGYSNRLAPAPVMINGRVQRVLETGMNTAFVSVDEGDKVGDEVILLGDAIDEALLADQLDVRPHEVLCRYTAMGPRRYVTDGSAAT